MCQPHPYDPSEEHAAPSPIKADAQRQGCVAHCDAGARERSPRLKPDAMAQARLDSAVLNGGMHADQTGVVIPFVVQHGPQLFLLAAESSEWVLAELQFNDESCTFVEVRKVRYAWPREAFGALLSRAAVSDDIDDALVEKTSDEFSRWLGAQFRGRSDID